MTFDRLLYVDRLNDAGIDQKIDAQGTRLDNTIDASGIRLDNKIEISARDIIIMCAGALVIHASLMIGLKLCG